MKKIFFKIFLSIIIFYSFFTIKVNAASMKSLNMDIYITEDGNAIITEVWNKDLNKNTENYRTFNGIEEFEISDFSVMDDSGTTYESVSKWNINASFEEKAYKCGIHNTSDGIELCWGISKYGNRTYTVKYNLRNFVEQYTDTQGIYFNFINLDERIDNAKVTIHSDIPFSKDNSKIWGFGYNGTEIWDNGNIVYDSGSNGLSVEQYITGLIRFENNIFNTSNKTNKSFDKILDEAFEDVPDEELYEVPEGEVKNVPNKKLDDAPNENFFVSIISSFILILFFSVAFFVFNPIVWLFAFFIIACKPFRKSDIYRTKVVNDTYIPRNDKDIDYWREIPCNKDLGQAYWVCSKYSVISQYNLKKGFIGAIFLKWIRDGYITVSKTKKGLFNFKDNNYALNFSKMKKVDNKIEQELYKMVMSAAGYNKILEAKEFSKWSAKNYYKVNSWFSNIINIEEEYLVEQGLITETEEKAKGFLGLTKTTKTKNINPKLKEEAIKLKGLRKFLLDFSMMPEREYFEVHMWEDYLIFAQLLGIADKVEEQFSKLYPDFNNQTKLNTQYTTIAVRNMAEICYDSSIKGMRDSESRSSRSSSSDSTDSSYDYSGSDRRSGGGGSSYSSGGSSARGSSGGGTR